MNKTGIIYMLTDTVHDMSYIGQTVDFDRRIDEHRRDKYPRWGVDPDQVIEVKLHENVSIDDLDQLEKDCIKIWDTMYPNGYNLTPGGDSCGFQDQRSTAWHYQQEIIIDYNNGVNLKEIARRNSCGVVAIRNILDDAGVNRKLRQRRKHDVWNSQQEIVVDYYDNVSIKEIAQRNSCSENTIRNILDNAKVEKRAQIGKKHDAWNFRQEIVVDYNNGVNLKEIAQRNSCSESTIRRILDGVKD